MHDIIHFSHLGLYQMVSYTFLFLVLHTWLHIFFFFCLTYSGPYPYILYIFEFPDSLAWHHAFFYLILPGWYCLIPTPHDIIRFPMLHSDNNIHFPIPSLTHVTYGCPYPCDFQMITYIVALLGSHAWHHTLFYPVTISDDIVHFPISSSTGMTSYIFIFLVSLTCGCLYSCDVQRIAQLSYSETPLHDIIILFHWVMPFLFLLLRGISIHFYHGTFITCIFLSLVSPTWHTVAHILVTFRWYRTFSIPSLLCMILYILLWQYFADVFVYFPFASLTYLTYRSLTHMKWYGCLNILVTVRWCRTLYQSHTAMHDIVHYTTSSLIRLTSYYYYYYYY